MLSNILLVILQKCHFFIWSSHLMILSVSPIIFLTKNSQILKRNKLRNILLTQINDKNKGVNSNYPGHIKYILLIIEV